MAAAPASGTPSTHTGPSYRALVHAGRAALGDTEGAERTARTLLACLAGKDPAYVFAYPEHEVDADLAGRFDAAMARLAGGEPLAYVLGHEAFYGRVFAVSEATLVPRDDTGALVEVALARLVRCPGARVVDLGTGTGIVAITLVAEAAAEGIALEMTATDIDPAALAVARDNAARLGFADIRFVAGDWFAPLAGQRFDAIVGNPPYVEADFDGLAALAHEPRHALVAGPAGLDAIEAIAAAAPAHLSPGGFIALEHGAGQGEAVARCFADAGLENIAHARDLSGHTRVTLGVAPAQQSTCERA